MQNIKNKESLILKNAFILSISVLICKILGAFYQAFLYYNVGPEAVGLYMKGINFYAMLLAFSASGIPIALSKLISEKIAKKEYCIAYKIFKISLFLLIFIGFILSVMLFLFSDFIARNIFFDVRIVWILKATSPALFLVTILSVFRGYFQGKQDMIPTAYSQVIEQIGRVFFSVFVTLFFINFFSPIPVFTIIDSIALGPFIGSFFGFLIILYFFYKDKKNIKYNYFLIENKNINSINIVKKIIFLSIPITLSAILPTLIDVFDSIIIPNKLIAFGYTQSISDAYFGAFSGAIITLINLITLIGSSFGISLVPAISEAKIKNDVNEINKKINLSIKIVTLISLFSIILLFIMSDSILKLIFNDIKSGYILKFSVIMIVFMALYHNTTGILQGLGRIYIPMISLFLGLIINIYLLNILIPSKINILGAPIAHTLAYIVAFFINIYIIKKHLNIKMIFKKWFIKSILISLLSAIFIILNFYILKYFFGKLLIYKACIFINLIIIIFLSTIFFIFNLIYFKVITKKELISIPKINKIIMKVNFFNNDKK